MKKVTRVHPLWFVGLGVLSIYSGRRLAELLFGKGDFIQGVTNLVTVTIGAVLLMIGVFRLARRWIGVAESYALLAIIVGGLVFAVSKTAGYVPYHHGPMSKRSKLVLGLCSESAPATTRSGLLQRLGPPDEMTSAEDGQQLVYEYMTEGLYCLEVPFIILKCDKSRFKGAARLTVEGDRVVSAKCGGTFPPVPVEGTGASGDSAKEPG